MAKKKSKRPNLSQETLERARAELRGDFADSVPAAPAIGNGAAVAESKVKAVKRNPALATRRIPTLEELVAEYGYVLRDLRNLAILAVTLLAIIIVAAVVLPRPTG
ncbi:MAG: hypothetical protein IT324_28595 [Anaerolineae bacterium]|nr:hypothetical protein [Anaerolineae bacterium]